jgi:hypothetical protein
VLHGPPGAARSSLRTRRAASPWSTEAKEPARRPARCGREDSNLHGCYPTGT